MSEDPWKSSAEDWQNLQRPLRPPPEDTAVVERIAAGLVGARGPLRVVMLGVTPETAGCRWPTATSLSAFDGSAEIINRLWPAPGAPAGATARVANWSALPVETGAADLVAADGSLGCLGFPDDVTRVLAEVRRILRPGGRFVVRVFLRPSEIETIEGILVDLEAGRIVNPCVLKMRVGGALHHDGWAGFSMYKMWKLWPQLFPDLPAVARRRGWPPQSLALLPRTETDDLVLVYPTMEELRSLFAQCFRVVEVSYAHYELAERCPTFVLEPRKEGGR